MYSKVSRLLLKYPISYWGRSLGKIQTSHLLESSILVNLDKEIVGFE